MTKAIKKIGKPERLCPISQLSPEGGPDLSRIENFAYYNDFINPFITASKYFNSVEFKKSFGSNPLDILNSQFELMMMNFNLFGRSLISIMNYAGEYMRKDMIDTYFALLNTFSGKRGEDTFEELIYRKFKAMELLTRAFPKAILNSEKEFGFHFEKRNNKKIAETKRFILYRINPTDPDVVTDPKIKPVLIIPPYVLGANILAFLPNQNKSYAHSFANRGIPTYIRIQKDIADNEAVQLMTPEDDLMDTVHFCEKIKKIHGKKVTLNGYCQGGFFAVCNILSGKLDDLCDTLITNVAPMDGTRNKGLNGFLKNIPDRYNDLSYGTKTLPNGNKVADGEIMSWIYKLNSIETEIPFVSILKKIAMFDFKGNKNYSFNLAYAALNYWLANEKTDLPLGITKFSYDSFMNPVTENGILPVRLFGEPLNFKRIKEKNINWLICYGEKDDLVEKRSALAPLDYIDVETTSFPKGHVAIATQWSDPGSKFALDKRYDNNSRGPVLYHLEMDQKSIRK